MVRRRDVLLAVLAAARPCAAWVVFDGKRLEQVVPSGQLAKNSSDVLTTGETIRLSLSDGFPGMFRWSAKPALRYAVSPDFCDAMKGTMIEEDGWLLDMFPESLHPPIKWTTCDRLRQIVRQAFDSWQENNPSLHFVDVTDRCTAEQAWLPIDELLCADSQPCLTLYDTEGRAGPGSTAVDDNNNPEICSSKTCFECERADILIGAFIQGGRQLAEVGTRMRVIDRQLSDQPPLGANGVVQPGGELYGAKLEILVDPKVFVDFTDDKFDGDGENFTQIPHCWRVDADWCPSYVGWGQERVNTAATALFGVLFALCICGCICGCLMCLQRLVTNLLAGWDLDQDGKVEIHEIMYVLDEFCGEICFECRCPNLHQQKMSKLEGVLGIFETITQMNAVLALTVIGCCILLPMAYATEVSTCWSCADLRAGLAHEVGHLLALDNADVWSENITFTHDPDRSPYPPFETDLLDCMQPEKGVVLGEPRDVNASLMRKFFLTNMEEPAPRRCLSSDDLAALNYLYPSCSGTMLIRPACGARATGRAPATRLLLNFASVFTIPALIVVGMKLLSLLFVASQTLWAKWKLARGARAVVQEQERQNRLKDRMSSLDYRQAFNKFDKDKSGNLDYKELRKALKSVGMKMDSSKAKAMLAKYDADGSGEMDFAEFKALCDELRGTGSKPAKAKKTNADKLKENIEKAKAKKAKREAREAGGGDHLMRLGIGRKAKEKAEPPAAAPEPAPAPAPAVYVSPARRALEEEMRRSAERAEAKASQLAKESKKAEIRANPKAYEAEKEAKKMAAKAAELKRIAASSSDHANTPTRIEGTAQQDEEGRVILHKGKGKGKAPPGSVAADLGF